MALDAVYIGVERNKGNPRHFKVDSYLQNYADEKSFVVRNGVLGSEQTNWFGEELSKTRSRKKRVIVCGHHPLVSDAAASQRVISDAGEAFQALSEYQDVVAAYVAVTTRVADQLLLMAYII